MTRKLVLADDDANVVRASDIVQYLHEEGATLRMAGSAFGTSASVLSVFLRRNGYKVARTGQTWKRG